MDGLRPTVDGLRLTVDDGRPTVYGGRYDKDANLRRIDGKAIAVQNKTYRQAANAFVFGDKTTQFSSQLAQNGKSNKMQNSDKLCSKCYPNHTALTAVTKQASIAIKSAMFKNRHNRFST